MDAIEEALLQGQFGALVAYGSSEDANIRYLTRFSTSDPVLFIRKAGERGVIVVPQMEYERASREATASVMSRAEAGFFEVQKEEKDPWRALARVVLGLVDGAILVPPGFPYALGCELARERRVEVDRVVLSGMREVKTSFEVARIRHVQHVCDKAMDRGIRLIAKARERKGLLFSGAVPLTSSMVRSAMHQVIIRNGCIATDTIVACGRETAIPHERGQGQLEAGQPIVIDVFPRDEKTGYYSDMTRTVSRGEPSAEIAEMFEAVRGAQDLAARLIRPGVPGASVHQAVVDFFRDAGYESGTRGFVHNLGHGVGLEVHEGPGLGPAGGTLREGNVVTDEPGLYFPGTGGVRLENTGVVRRRGFSPLTRYQRELVV
ncbi:MAG: Xaa-Pro peptidase family protein [Methanolinea sp.]|nr:Xaa-Pro peptidase family protein [Methanolinea sp.]